MQFSKNFQNLSKYDADIAGGKGASLGEMTKAGIPVPLGFVVLSTTFDQFIREADLIQEIEACLSKVDHKKTHTVENASEKIQELIENAKMPLGIAKEIKTQFKKLNTKYVAVRSSATAEDGAEHAWAGQLDSYLNITEKNLLEKVQHCWASLFTPRAIFYRFEKGLHATQISVAVVIQKMVNSEKSGIAFSVHPVTEDPNQLIIEAGFGLGEAIVSGQITPDSYVVEKKSKKIIDININSQAKGLYRNLKGGNVWKDLGAKGEKQVLNEKEILELSKLILKIENHYGFPCDIEWAYACPGQGRREKNKFYITQSRPITTLKSIKKENNKVIKKDKEWIFMWSFPLLMPYYWSACHVLLRKNELYSNGEVFCYFDGQTVTTFMPKIQLEDFKIKGRNFLDKKYFKKYQKKYFNEKKKWWNWIRKIEKKDYSEIKDIELVKDLKKFIEYSSDSIECFGNTRSEFTFAVEQRLEEIVKKHYKKRWIEIFGILISSTVFDDIQKEYIDWLGLIQKNPNKKTLLKHVSKYPWLVFGQLDDEEIMKFLNDRMENEKGQYKYEIKKQKKEKQIIKNKKDLIFKEIKESAEEVRYLSNLIEKQSIERMNIKSYWAGAYYLSHNMWLKIANETKLSFQNMINYVTPPELIQIIQGDYKENIELIINDRKKSLALLVSNGKLRIFGSKVANSLFYKNIKKQKKTEKFIRGQIAMAGFVCGKVRKVAIGDLNMLQKSIKYFKHGEILVTSMTQPNMMVIAQRAIGIIADEGGITSHAAIIARELKIPCVVGCMNAMEQLYDGDLVEVDANRGLVRILNRNNKKVK